MPVINGVYLKDFPALPSSVTDANIIPIAISGNQIAYRTTVAGIVTDARVTSKLLTGLSVTGSTISATDTILQAFGKVQNQLNGKVSSVGLTMPAAFNVANSPITSAGTLAVTAAGVASQYIRGDGALADFPTTGGGGSSVSYYLNGSVSQGTFVGNTYYEMNKTPVIGTGTDFTIGADGYIAQFITDANDPASLLIPAGNWNVEMYFSASSNGGSPSFYVEVYKYDGTTFTLLGTSSATPEGITNGTAIDIYYTSVGIPETVLTITDRIAIRVYVTHSGRTITLHTEDNHLSEIITTFSNGLTTLNGLTKQAQYFAVGSTGTDFAIVSSVDTHTFNIPDASASARGLITTGAQTIAGAKTISSTLASTFVGQFFENTGASTSAKLIRISNTSGDLALGLEGATPTEIPIAEGGIAYSTVLKSVGSTSLILGTLSKAALTINTSQQVTLTQNLTGTTASFSSTLGLGGALTGTTANFTGQLTLGSTITNGTYTYTLPGATGTLALTSALTGYVPYTGATTNVALGIYNLSLSDLAVNNIGANNNGANDIGSLGGNTFRNVYANSFVKTSGTSSQFLKADGSSDTTTYQGAITLTTTGTSGAATFVANTLNIPNYADGGVLSLSAIGATANANAATITGTVLNLQPASASFGGVVTTGTQTFAGDKTLTGTLYGIGLSMTGTTADIVQGTATSGKALRGTATTGWGLYASATTGVGVQGNSSGTGGTGVFGSSVDGYGGVFYNDSTTYPALEVNNNNESAGDIAVFRRVGTSVFIINGLGNISNGTYTYTLPSATGTLALTSALSGYLPLTGGTLTGALSGTSASFSSTATATAFIPSGATVPTNGMYLSAANTLNFSTNTTSRLSIASTGAATFSSGISVGGATATTGGIQFPATQVAIASANNLDDYEEGTWTPGLKFAASTAGITYSAQSGTYTKIGRQVTVNGFFTLSNKGAAAGQAVITGLPFTIANTSGNYSVANFRFSVITYSGTLTGLAFINDTSIGLEQTSEAGSLTDITNTNFANTSSVIISLTYFV